jgi:hypothetical protein
MIRTTRRLVAAAILCAAAVIGAGPAYAYDGITVGQAIAEAPAGYVLAVCPDSDSTGDRCIIVPASTDPTLPLSQVAEQGVAAYCKTTDAGPLAVGVPCIPIPTPEP